MRPERVQFAHWDPGADLTDAVFAAAFVGPGGLRGSRYFSISEREHQVLIAGARSAEQFVQSVAAPGVRHAESKESLAPPSKLESATV